MILESVVTSVSRQGNLNIAPMGPHVEYERRGQQPPGERYESANEIANPIFTLRPFVSSQTYQNLKDTRAAVIHVTDDVELFARAAVDAITPSVAGTLVRVLEGTPFRVLVDCHRWFAVEIEAIDESDIRAKMRCRVVQSGVVRPFFGFNRAKHAVIEAAILATRTHLLDSQTIEQEWTRLQPLVDKTAGPAERRAFDFLRKTIDERSTARS